MTKGRPLGRMTMRRVQVLAVIDAAALLGTRPTYCEIARRCEPPLFSGTDAKRIVRDIEMLRVSA